MRKAPRRFRSLQRDALYLGGGMLVAALALADPARGEEPTAPRTDRPAEWVVFSSGRSGDGDLLAIDPATGRKTGVVETPAPEGSARLDVARGRLVHIRYEPDDSASICAGDEVLFPSPSADSAPVWSPTGERIAWADRRDGEEDLFLARSDGTAERRLTSDAEPDRYPAWSPDGKRLVFARQLAGGWDLHAIGIEEGAVPERLTKDGRYVGHPAWSPDGRFVAFDTRIDGDIEIAVLELATGEISRVTERPGNDMVPAWSADGRKLAFGGVSDESDVGNWDVWVVDLDRRELTRLTTHPAFDGGPVFVPHEVLRPSR